MKIQFLPAALVSAALLAPFGAAQNLLTNPDFEAGLTGWTSFGNAFAESANPPEIDPLSGTGEVKMFGNFSGGFDVSGIFQQFPAAQGDSFTIDAWSRMWSGDTIPGNGPPADNWVVMKMAFFDGGGTEIGGAEGVILDGNSPTDTWIDNPEVTGTAPAGTTSVQCLILYLQPGNDGGAAHIDDVSFTANAPLPPPTGNLLANPGFEAGTAGWDTFGNAFGEPTNLPEIDPQTGTGVLKMFGNFSGGFNVSGAFQTYGAAEGQTFSMDCASRHWSGDPMIGAGPSADNWAVMKIAFFDAGGTEIAGTEQIVCDGTFPTDTWIDNPSITGTAPAGTETVQALLLYLQPAFDGGGCQFDDVEFTTVSSCDISVNGGFETGDLTGWQVFESAAAQTSIVSPGSSSNFAVRINNQQLASASLIKNANIGIGPAWPAADTVQPGETVVISLDARGTTAVGGVAFAEFFSELSAGGTSQNEILGGAPLALDPDPTVWTTFSFTTTTGPDVSGGVTLQLAAITGGAPGSVADIEFDNISVRIVRPGPTWSNYGTGFAGTNGVPGLTLDSNPTLGQTVGIQVGNSLGAPTPAVLLFGGTQLEIPTPFGGSLLNEATVPVNLPALAAGGDTVALDLPANGALCGISLYCQSIQFDAGASAGLAFSRGLRFILGGNGN